MLSTIDKGEEDHCMVVLLSISQYATLELQIIYIFHISVDENRIMLKTGYFNFSII